MSSGENRGLYRRFQSAVPIHAPCFVSGLQTVHEVPRFLLSEGKVRDVTGPRVLPHRSQTPLENVRQKLEFVVQAKHCHAGK